MDRNEAKLLLQACRPNGQDDASPAFAEALALVERDPELKAWWTAQRAFDRAMSSKMNAIPLPADLRATILAGRKIEQMTPRFQLPYWLAAAAMVMLCVGLGFYVSKTPSANSPYTAQIHTTIGPVMDSTDYEAKALAFLDDDSPSLGMTSTDHERVAAWLKQQHSPMGVIPSKMVTLPSVGCQTFQVHGHAVSLICFNLAGGGYAHLFTIEKGAITDPPGTSPDIQTKGEWTMASWSDGDHTYMLATTAGADKLKGLL